MPRLLVIDPDPDAQAEHRGYLMLEGFETDWFEQGSKASDALAKGEVGPPDVILVDPFGAGIGGLSICQTLRTYTSAPILILSRCYSEGEVVTALQNGADEYLAKPVSNTELSARLRALVRRASGRHEDTTSGVLRFGRLEISLPRHEVRKCGRKIELSPTEFRLLACLVQEPDRVISHRSLMTRVWGAEYVESRHYLRLYIRYLREKLEDDPAHPRLILSEWGMGYVLQDPTPSA